MKKNNWVRKIPAWVPMLLCLFLAALGIFQYAGLISIKYVAIVAAVGIILLFVLGDLSNLWNLPSLLLLGYVAFSMLTLFWAMSGKFFLQRYSNIFAAAFFFLLVVLCPRTDGRFVRRVMGILAGIGTLYALISIEALTTGYFADVLGRFSFWQEFGLGASGRMIGIFQNANVEASFFALGAIFSIALICGAENKTTRALWTAALTINAVALLLGISIGALACFAVSMVVYLVIAGKGRSAALIRMLEAAMPAFVCAVFSSSRFNVAEREPLPLLLTVAAAVVAALLEWKLADKLCAMLEAHEKAVARSLALVAALLVAYVLIGTQVAAPYTFGSALFRSAPVTPGEHTIQVEADGDVQVYIGWADQEIIMNDGYLPLTSFSTADESYQRANAYTFVVPAGNRVCSFSFRGAEGVTIRSAVLDGGTPIKLASRLLPDFLANRLQNGLTTSNSYVLRSVLARDGMKLFRLSPIVGNGVGSFETGITRVQEYYFETRYVHQHYIQILLEDGVIGFALFVGSLAAMLVALWKKREQSRDSELLWIYPAFCAEMIMNDLQMLWDVSMSIFAFLCCTYAVYGLVVRSCAEPIRIKARTLPNQTQLSEEDEEDEEKAVPTDTAFPVRLLLVVMPVMYLLSICGNLYAAYLTSREFASYEEAYTTMEKAVDFDLYERNDIMLTYVLMSIDDESQDNHISQANVYADRLSRVQSNRIPYYLVAYYFNSMQYARAIDEAMLGATYSASDAEQWSNIIGLLKQGFIDSGVQSPLLTRDNGLELLDKLAAYSEMLKSYNANALKQIELTEESEVFLTAVSGLKLCNGDTDAMREMLASGVYTG